jgi:hypothetical protein
MAGCETKALSREAPVTLVPSFVDLLQPLTCVMSAPTFQSFMTLMCRKDKSRVVQCLGRVYAAPARLLKIVAVEPLCGGRIAQAFFSTCPNDSIQEVLVRYAARWSIEVTYHEAKGQLGFEQPQGWSKLAVKRTAPVAMLLYSLVVVWFSREGHRHYRPPTRPWYTTKAAGPEHASFADMLNTLRCQSVKQEVLSMHLHGRGSRNIVKCLIHAVNQAA